MESRHLLYLQLRKSILESHILCNDEELISLGGLALQSEIGDFTEPVRIYKKKAETEMLSRFESFSDLKDHYNIENSAVNYQLHANLLLRKVL